MLTKFSSSQASCSVGKTAMEESAEAAIYRKKLAVAQGELEGYSCKVEGFKHALEELEMQLSEKDLQVAMLKSVIVDAENPASLEFRLIEALEVNRQLQQQLQRVTAQLAAAHSAAAVTTPRPAQQQQRRRWHDAVPCRKSDVQQQDCQSTQLLMLRKALTAANMRLTSNGLLPVAATSDLLEAQDLIDSWPGDQGIPFASCTPAQTTAAPSSSHSDRAVSPALGLPALCLFSKLSAVSEDGTGTPLSGSGERFLGNSSRCSTPADDITPGRPTSSGGDVSVDAACIVVAASNSLRRASAAGKPAAALSSCTWRDKGPADYSSNADDESDADSELSDDYDAGGLGVYPDSQQYGHESSMMQPPGPVLDNPLFLHNRPECSG